MGMTLYDIDAQIAALDGAAEDDMLIDEETESWSLSRRRLTRCAWSARKSLKTWPAG